MNKQSIKISLAAALLLCLLDMPYWYFQLIRILATLGFGYLAYVDYMGQIKNNSVCFWIWGTTF
jgi:hypothetical protein